MNPRRVAVRSTAWLGVRMATEDVMKLMKHRSNLCSTEHHVEIKVECCRCTDDRNNGN